MTPSQESDEPHPALQTYLETIADGLAPLTDLLLSNYGDVVEMKELVYARWRLEDERHEACDAQRRDMQDMLHNLTERLGERPSESGEPGSSRPQSADQIRRLLDEMKALREERLKSVRQFIEGVREAQNQQTSLTVQAIRQIRSTSQQMRR